MNDAERFPALSVTVAESLDRQLKGERILCSTVGVDHGGEVTQLQEHNSWLYCIHSQETMTDE